VRAPFFFPLIFCAALTTSPALATANGVPQIYVVPPGDCLESIAKRHGVSVETLRRVNGMTPESVLKAGQRLTIPAREDQDEPGSLPAANVKAKTASGSAPLPRASAPPASPRGARDEETPGNLVLRYDNAEDALAAAKARRKSSSARVSEPSTLARASDPVNASWKRYVRRPEQQGHLDVSTHVARFSGPALDSEGRVLPSAARALNELLGAGGEHPRMPERLLRLLVKVSDTFGGRPLRAVSGYRTTSYFKDSRHKQSSAVDFIVVGVPNAVVCDYLREFDDVGVGYYPNSTFVHLDVRDHSAYWVDYSGPGEAPRPSPNAPAAPRPNRALIAELRKLLANATEAIEQARASAEHETSEPSPRERTRSSKDAIDELHAPAPLLDYP
jgi:uncharacterized protein YcbK (DUF882 family)